MKNTIGALCRCVLLVALVSSTVASAEPMFVLATSLNVRDKPSAKGTLVYVARLGERCELVAPDAAGWSRVDCGGFVGVTKTEFLGKDAPTLGNVTPLFTSAWAKAKEAASKGEDAAGGRYDQAMSLAQRYAQLGGDRPQLRSFLEELFLFQASGPAVGKVYVLNIERECPDLDLCRMLRLTEQLPGVEVSRFTSGDIFAALRGLGDGNFYMVGGSFSGETFSTSVAQYLALSPAMVAALGGKAVADPCPTWSEPGLLCSAPSCDAGVRTCHSCSVGCGANCNSCRNACKVGNYAACATACRATCATCVAACQKSLGDTCAAKP
ncbi:MAG: hypothetical protein Q8O67_21470 [Deltaproteobacteria bacterium]|nr:hypothetical protein [Deltaproteobacteria bacterium]